MGSLGTWGKAGVAKKIESNMKNSCKITCALPSQGLRLLVFFTAYFFCFTSVLFAQDGEPDKSEKKEVISELPRCKDLPSCYERAVLVNENIERRKSEIDAAKARYRQAIAMLFPTVDFIAQQRVRDSEFFGVLGGSNFDPGQSESTGVLRSRNLGKTQSEGFVNVRQPLFSGFREFILADAMEYEQESGKLLLERQRELLYQEVAEAYYQILFYRRDHKLLTKTEGVLQQRIKELQEFIALGRARESELVATQADISAVNVGRAQTDSLMAASREYLHFLVDQPIHDLQDPLPVPVPNTTALAQLLEQAGKRQDRLAAGADIRSASLTAKAIRRELWPQLAVEGNAFAFEDPDRTREWEALLRVEVPLFDGGSVRARAAEVDAQTRSLESLEREIARQIEREVRQAYDQLHAAQAEEKALQDVVLIRRKNFELQRRDYSLGVVNNIEVLDAIRAQFEAERRLQEAYSRTAIRRANLDVAVGGVQP